MPTQDLSRSGVTARSMRRRTSVPRFGISKMKRSFHSALVAAPSRSRFCKIGAVLALLAGGAMSLMEPAQAQSPAQGAAVTAPAPVVHATLNQLMRGPFYPASNVFFAAQALNPADVPRA